MIEIRASLKKMFCQLYVITTRKGEKKLLTPKIKFGMEKKETTLYPYHSALI